MISAQTTRAPWQKAALAVACASALTWFAAPAYALSLGRVVVQSALGEPLRAEVELLDISAEEAASLRARLASPESFAASGMEYSPALKGLQITLEQDGSRRYLRLSNPQSVSEPYVDLILEATWASGRLVRDYTLLFDPPAAGAGTSSAAANPSAPADATASIGNQAPVFTPPVTTALPATTEAAPPATPEPVAAPAATPAPAPVSTPVTAASEPQAAEPAPPATTSAAAGSSTESAAAPAATAPTAENTPAPTQTASAAPAAATKPPAAPKPAAPRARVTVKSGDTASEIAMAQMANQPAYVQVSLNQMLIAMLRANPHAFVNGNVNRLRAGVVLNMPGAETGQAVSRAQARQLVIAQNLDFDEYRRRLGDAAPTRAAAAQRQSGGNVQPQVQDRKAASTTPDKLTLSKGAMQAQGAQALAQERKAQEAAERSAAMNKNIAELEKLNKASQPAASGPGVGAAAPAAGSAASGSVPVASATGAAAQDAAAAEPSKSVSFDELVNDMLANPIVPAVGAGLAALLIGLLIYRRRKQNAAPMDYQDSLQTGAMPADKAGDAPSTAPGEDVDPVAEAELYLSYGRDQQAEDILKDALPRQPLRVAIHQKLAEIYAKRNDMGNFALIATQAHQASGGKGPEWEAIRTLGHELDPDNELYQSEDDMLMSRLAEPALPKAEPTPDTSATSQAAPAQPTPAEFDLSSLSLDLDSPSGLGLSTEPTADENDDDPLATKLALADEFKAIGDTDGARALIEEIIAEAKGPMKARAEEALAALG